MKVESSTLIVVSCILTYMCTWIYMYKKSFLKNRLYKHKNVLKTRANKMEWNWLTLCGIRRRKRLTYHSIEYTRLIEIIFIRFKELYALLNREVPHLIIVAQSFINLVSKCRHESKYYLSKYKGFQPN